MAANTPLIVGDRSQDAILAFSRECYSMLQDTWNFREQMRAVDLAYMREVDSTREQAKAKTSNRLGDPTKFQNVIVPVVMPQVEAAVTYQASVFLTGTPMFDWVAPPSQIDAAKQFSAITEENQIRGGWIQQFMILFKDLFKYNRGHLEVGWEEQIVPAIETDTSFMTGRQGKPKEVVWRGNTMKRWDPYNTFWDCRYAPTDVYKKGEFIGKTEFMSRIHLKAFIAALPDKMVQNVKAAFESGLGASYSSSNTESYYIPSINPEAFVMNNAPGKFNWMGWAGLLERPQGEIQYQNGYEVTTLYARIIPQDFRIKVPAANTPQVWKFIIVNHRVVIYAERQTNAHNYLPVLTGQPYEDGLAYQTKSLAENSRPFQEIGSALVNSAMAARRRAISDRGIYNPLLIAAQHINNDSPTAKIPMRPAGYNKNPTEAYAAIPFRDEQSGTAFQELGQILSMANTMNGSNQAKQGQFVKGNKTLREYESVMANANGRDQVISMVLEAQLFTPAKEMMKINTLQYHQPGEIYSALQDRQVKVDPVALRRAAVAFKITDGLNPTDKVINGDDFGIALQTVGSSPQINSQYNLGPMFSYLMKTRNVDLVPFEKSPQQVAYEQALAAWQNAVTEIAKVKTADGSAPQFPPQPKPQDYGYDPAAPTGQPANNSAGFTGGPAQSSAPTSALPGVQ